MLRRMMMMMMMMMTSRMVILLRRMMIWMTMLVLREMRWRLMTPQSTCNCTCHNGHFAREFTAKMRRPRPGPTLCASQRSRNARQHVTRATVYGNLPGAKAGSNTLSEPAKSKRLGDLRDFTRATFIQKFLGKMPRTSCGPELRHTHTHPHTPAHTHTHSHFAQACAIAMHTNMSQEPFFMEIYGKIARTHNRNADFVRVCAVEMHRYMSQSHFIRKFAGKMPQTKVSTPIKHRPLQLV